MFNETSKQQAPLLPRHMLRCSPATLASLLSTSVEELPLACEKALEEDPSIASLRPGFCMIGVGKLLAMEQTIGGANFESEEVLDKNLLIAIFGGSEDGIYSPSFPLAFSKESFMDVLYFPDYEIHPLEA